MKKSRMFLLIAAGLLAIALGAAQTAGAAGIVGSKHDLTTNNNSGGVTLGDTTVNNEVCIYCHTPHGGDGTGTSGPLWNRELPVATGYTLYSSDTLDSTPGQPTGVSRACLSCHDGTVGFNSLTNNRGPGFGTDGTGLAGNTNFQEFSDTQATGGDIATFIGRDLSNDHPISMAYSSGFSPSSADGANTHAEGFVPETDPAFDLVLYGGQVQCGTCHDPHRNPIENQVGFLRKSNTGSALCLTCHRKNIAGP